MEQNKLYYGNNYINYIKENSKSSNKDLAIIFFSGLMSNVNSTKAVFLSEFCKNHEIEYIRFDYYGHGESSGKFTDGTVTIWLENCLNVIKSLTDKKVIIVGSSLGGWLMLLTALKIPSRIKALVGIASAIDFTENIVWNNLSDHEKSKMETEGKLDFKLDGCDDGYEFSINLIKDARNHLLLDSAEKLNIDSPIILIHGMQDKDIPYNISLELIDKIKSENIKTILVKDAGHNLNRNQDLETIAKNLETLI